ncbi:hypothetical protein NE237_030250 [Protea cynaroides]|uniref:Uncharacterized protein n=1 Tax=Protea cynaroides TaxID=273540 RepID=A0A9Q0JX21_9MAGN|nr:hypothetical protein NE237_030250 [Protea cynaroides]
MQQPSSNSLSEHNLFLLTKREGFSAGIGFSARLFSALRSLVFDMDQIGLALSFPCLSTVSSTLLIQSYMIFPRTSSEKLTYDQLAGSFAVLHMAHEHKELLKWY